MANTNKNTTANVLRVLRGMGYRTVNDEVYTAIRNWREWYEGRVKAFHDYRIWNGQKYVDCIKAQAGMAKKCAEDWADLAMSEKVAITLEGKAEQAFFDKVCKANNWQVQANKYEELAFALGTSAYVARVSGVEIDEDGNLTEKPAQSLKIDYVTADNTFPLSWENGIISECAFATRKTVKGKNYLYLQIHKLNDAGEYDILNYLYDNTNGGMKAASLGDVTDFAAVPDVFHTRQKEPLFVINTPNIANNLDPDCPLGLSVYANAIDQLKAVDNAFDSFNNEIVLGRKRVAIKPEAMKGIKGEQLFDPNDVVFYYLPEDSQPGTMIQEMASTMRVSEIYQAIQLALNTLSMKTGLGANHWKFDGGNFTTATQVISANSDEFRTLKKHELILGDVIERLARITLRLGNAFMGENLNEDVEISIDFDDSIIEDDDKDFQRDVQMLSMGIINPYEFRMKWMNEDEETAKEALPKLEELSEEPPEE